MKIKTSLCDVEIENIFLIVFFISAFSKKIMIITKYFYICYLFIIFHELAHIFIGTILGRELEKIKLSISGVNAIFSEKRFALKENKNNIYEILIYIVGPISNFIFSILFFKIDFVRDINLFLALINLLPIYPLDGYNILINIFEIKKYEIKNVDRISKIILVILIISAISQYALFKNISIIIFCLYLYLIKNKDKKILKLT